MSTRCLTVFFEEDGKKEIAVMYRHCGGYPEGHGTELKEFLAGKKITNGIGADTEFNGMGCLAAAVVQFFKDGPGGIYLMPAGTRGVGEEYIYEVRGKVGKPATIKTRKR
jgi:hypothetical protein